MTNTYEVITNRRDREEDQSFYTRAGRTSGTIKGKCDTCPIKTDCDPQYETFFEEEEALKIIKNIIYFRVTGYFAGKREHCLLVQNLS